VVADVGGVDENDRKEGGTARRVRREDEAMGDGLVTMEDGRTERRENAEARERSDLGAAMVREWWGGKPWPMDRIEMD
jgi:hypothetical protein